MAVRDRILRLLAEPRQLAILAGAGVSMPPPSGLPGAIAFLQALFEDVSADREHRQVLREAIAPQRGQRQTVGDYLRFETVMHALQTEVDPRLDVLTVFSSCSRPNAYHRFLAAQLARGVAILTTNFDNLIEQSCREEGIAYDLLVTEDDLDAWIATPSRFAHPLVKLHGGRDLRYSDGRALAGASNLGATIVEVARAGLSNAGRVRLPGVLARIAESRHLLVCGYSGCDDLDVIPALAGIDRLSGVTWLDHSQDGGEESIDETALAAAERTPDGVVLEPSYRLLQQFLSRSPRPDVVFVRCSTGEACGIEFDATPYAPGWQDRYDVWRSESLRADAPRARLVARLLCAAGANSLAADVLASHLARSDVRGADRVRSQCFLADLLIVRGDFEPAIDLLIDVIGQPPDARIDAFRAVAYTLLARTEIKQGRDSNAVPFLNAAIAVAEAAQIPWALLDALYEAGQVSLALGSGSEGLNQLRQVTEASREIGDCFSVAVSHCAMGAALTRAGDRAAAREELDKGIRLAETIGDRRTLLFGHHARGVLAEQERQWARARAEYEKAIHWARVVDQPLDLGHSLNNLGKVAIELGDPATARRALLESLRIKRRLNDAREVMTVIVNIGAMYMYRLHLKQAIRALRIGERLAVRAGRSDELQEIREMLAMVEAAVRAR